MRILVLVPDLSKFGGIQFYNRFFVDALKTFGHTTSVVERKFCGNFLRSKFFFKCFSSFLLFKPDIVICAHINFSPICLLFSLLRKVRYCVILYGIDASAKKALLKKIALLRATATIVIFQWTKTLIESTHHQLRGRIFIIPSPVDEQNFDIRAKDDALLNHLGLRGKIVLLTVCRLQKGESKGYNAVIRCLPSLLQRFPNVHYVIVGDGNDRSCIESLVCSLQLTHAVTIRSGVDNQTLPAYYNLCDVFIMPSKREGFAIVFLEALASGKPVIAGQYAGEELDDSLGKYVDPDDGASVENAIISVLDDLSAFYPPQLRNTILRTHGRTAFQEAVKNMISML